MPIGLTLHIHHLRDTADWDHVAYTASYIAYTGSKGEMPTGISLHIQHLRDDADLVHFAFTAHKGQCGWGSQCIYSIQGTMPIGLMFHTEHLRDNADRANHCIYNIQGIMPIGLTLHKQHSREKVDWVLVAYTTPKGKCQLGSYIAS